MSYDQIVSVYRPFGLFYQHTYNLVFFEKNIKVVQKSFIEFKKTMRKCVLFLINWEFEGQILSLHSLNLYSKIRKLDGKVLNNKFLGKGDL